MSAITVLGSEAQTMITLTGLALLTIVVCLLVLVGLGVMVTISVRRTLRDLAHDVAGSTRNNEWHRGHEAGLREGGSTRSGLTARADDGSPDAERLDVLLGQMFPESPSTQDDYRAAAREVIREYDRGVGNVVTSGAMISIAQRHTVRPATLRKIASSILGARS